MVKVATNLDLPIKILWPKSLSFSADGGFTMLGLGDIVIPGTFIALALRYDHHRHVAALKDTSSVKAKYAKPYFYAAMLAYVAGLITTMTVMHVFRAAQVSRLVVPLLGLF
jgi:minor histocompatibility antigen H13